MAAHERVGSRVGIFVREDHAVLTAIRSVGGRLIESIHETDREELVREILIVGELAFGRRAATRKSVERRNAAREVVVAMRAVRIDRTGPRILRVVHLTKKLIGGESGDAASFDELREHARERERRHDRFVGDFE